MTVLIKGVAEPRADRFGQQVGAELFWALATPFPVRSHFVTTPPSPTPYPNMGPHQIPRYLHRHHSKPVERAGFVTARCPSEPVAAAQGLATGILCPV